MSTKHNFFHKISVSTTSFTNHMVSWDFNSAGFLLLNESTVSGRIIEYSFDGTTVHGDMDPDLPSAGIAFDSRHQSRIYFRLKSAGAPATVRVEAWQ